MVSFSRLFGEFSSSPAIKSWDTDISSPIIILDIETPLSTEWKQAGWIRAISNLPGIGESKSLPQMAYFGKHQYTMDPIEFPYQLEFAPKAWVRQYRLALFTDSREFRQTTASSSLNPQELALLDEFAVPSINLRLKQDDTELLLAVLQALHHQGKNSMPGSDIRSMIEAAERSTLQGEANALKLTQQGVTIASTIAEMVVERVITVEKSAFNLLNSVWIADIEHSLNNSKPSVTVYDNDGDLQLVEFIAVDANNGRLELSANQYRDNAFPLTIKLQGKPSSTVAVSEMNVVTLSQFGMKFRRNASNSGGSIESSPIGAESWINFGTSDNISSAHILGEVLYVIGASGSYALNLPSGGWYAIPMTDFDATRLTGITL